MTTLGFVGLGHMGGNMAARFLGAGYTVYGETRHRGEVQDLEREGTRRLLVNACYWAMGMEDKIPPCTNVDIVGDYKATPFRGNGFTKGLKPADYEMKSAFDSSR